LYIVLIIELLENAIGLHGAAICFGCM
jgi:hypothetical protein